MYRNILVPVAYDAGFNSQREIAVARALLAPGGKVHLLHVMDPAPVIAISYEPEGWREEMIAAIKADLTSKADTLPDARIDVIDGEPGHAILDAEQARGIDCIVLASHRSDPSLFGSTASWIARHATCAVHLIR
ncbi:universal stress protein [Pararhodobacter oceanensis]|uniref:Universal stress protein n=1 Tax=Pararhodobacter oceanensis TaxID=2172121 RepID=A0A2T8HWZ7_9RHOB|nr:universal stress protein [Pararhodobacter oceanensis]PVH29945.1 universal stress protein [Pararhodobacter oceanensis]